MYTCTFKNNLNILYLIMNSNIVINITACKMFKRRLFNKNINNLNSIFNLIRIYVINSFKYFIKNYKN